jgi:hypothetical protein
MLEPKGERSVGPRVLRRYRVGYRDYAGCLNRSHVS